MRALADPTTDDRRRTPDFDEAAYEREVRSLELADLVELADALYGQVSATVRSDHRAGVDPTETPAGSRYGVALAELQARAQERRLDILSALFSALEDRDALSFDRIAREFAELPPAVRRYCFAEAVADAEYADENIPFDVHEIDSWLDAAVEARSREREAA